MDRNWFGSTEVVDLQVASLRRKLGNAGWIVAVRGVGFRFELPERLARRWGTRLSGPDNAAAAERPEGPDRSIT